MLHGVIKIFYFWSTNKMTPRGNIEIGKFLLKQYNNSPVLSELAGKKFQTFHTLNALVHLGIYRYGVSWQFNEQKLLNAFNLEDYGSYSVKIGLLWVKQHGFIEPTGQIPNIFHIKKPIYKIAYCIENPLKSILRLEKYSDEMPEVMNITFNRASNQLHMKKIIKKNKNDLDFDI